MATVGETQFDYNGNDYIVKYSVSRAEFVYRDKAHLGGPFSSVEITSRNSSIDIRFRRKLTAAVQYLQRNSPSRPITRKDLFDAMMNKSAIVLNNMVGVIVALEYEDGSGMTFNVRFSVPGMLPQMIFVRTRS